MAEVPSQHHRVELLGTDAIGLKGLGDHLGLDLSGLRFRLVPPVNERNLAPITAEYDVFVNCTYLSRLPSRARKSVYVVLFPHKTWPPPVVRMARRILGDPGPESPDPVIALEGFYDLDAWGSRWSRSVARFRVDPRAFHRGRARIRLAVPPERSLRDTLLEVRATEIDWEVRGSDLVLRKLDVSSTGLVDVELRCRTFVPAELGLGDDRRQLGVCLRHQTVSKRWGRFGRLSEQVAGRIDAHDPEILSSYDLLLSISEYTRFWVGKRWDLPSEVLPPPVDNASLSSPEPTKKQRIILSVGRFFHDAHNKKHVEMLRVFRSMFDRGEIPEGWEYHLVGNLHRDRLEDLEYFAELERLARGYPVELLVDLALDQLVEEYRRASIFWHAAGWGESERRRPEKFEHFGLTTCEAMSSGCIPVVIAKAGQLEIVEHGETGFLFTTAEELASITRRLIQGHGEPWTHAMMERATTVVERFARPRFEERLWEIFEAHDLLT